MQLKKIITILTLIFAISTIAIAQVNPNYHYVEGYFRKDGTYVRGHYKTNRNNTNSDNYSTKKNINPWTGEPGYIEPDGKNIANFTNEKKSEFLSEKYNMALALHDKKKYSESLAICKELLLEYEKPFHTIYLIGWNFIGLGNYASAVETFESLETSYSNFYLNLSPLYIAYKLNNNESGAIRILKKASSDDKNFKKFEEEVRSIIREIHLNYGLPNRNIMSLAFNEKEVYIGITLLNAINTCRDCKIEIIDPRIIDIGEGALKKRIFLQEEFVGPINAIEFLLPKSQFTQVQKILIELGFKYVGNMETPILIKHRDNGRKSTTESEVYIKSDFGILLSNVDLDGEENVDFFTVTIRK